MTGIEEQAKSFNIKAVLVSLIVSSFGFVAALFWRDAIKELIDRLVPEGEGLAYSFGAAIAVTIIAVAAIYLVSNYMTRLDLQDVKELKRLKGIRDLRRRGAESVKAGQSPSSRSSRTGTKQRG